MAVANVPKCDADVADAVADALRTGGKLAIFGGGSKSDIGAPVDARALPLTGLAGVADYDPAELVLTVGAGTPLAEVQALLAGNDQCLAFDPFDHGPIFGRPAGRATVGGVVAAGVSGSRRISGLAARDHLLGFRAVSGRAEIFSAGARVVKNVTGFDLPKLAAGSWGRLFAMTELTLKVRPRPRETATRVLQGLAVEAAVRAMSVAMGSQADVAAAAYLPAQVWNGESATILRVEGFGPSVAARCAMLDRLLLEFGVVRQVSAAEAAAMWDGLRSLSPLGVGDILWRVSVPARQACKLLASLDAEEQDFLLDWAGGLVWIAAAIDPTRMRAAAASLGGHAMLVRAGEDARRHVPAFHPPAAGLHALEARVRRAFDPEGVFETGRF